MTNLMAISILKNMITDEVIDWFKESYDDEEIQFYYYNKESDFSEEELYNLYPDEIKNMFAVDCLIRTEKEEIIISEDPVELEDEDALSEGIIYMADLIKAISVARLYKEDVEEMAE